MPKVARIPAKIGSPQQVITPRKEKIEEKNSTITGMTLCFCFILL